MNRILTLTRNTLQTQTLFLDDGTSFVLTIYFVPLQQGWFITNLVYKDFVLQGVRITNSPNMLHQFRNQLPFGLACFSKEDREPSLIEDFSSGASRLFILTQTEVRTFTEFLSG